jgi:hypothetical protein
MGALDHIVQPNRLCLFKINGTPSRREVDKGVGQSERQGRAMWTEMSTALCRPSPYIHRYQTLSVANVFVEVGNKVTKKVSREIESSKKALLNKIQKGTNGN